MNRRSFLGSILALLPLSGCRTPKCPPTFGIPGPRCQGQLDDLVLATLRDLGKPRFAEIAADLQRHVAVKSLLRTNRVKERPCRSSWKSPPT